MNRYLDAVFHLFFPERCAVCGCGLVRGAELICPRCQWDMPQTGYCRVHDNPVARKFWGLLPTEEASSLIFFSTNSPYRELIHLFKYKGQWGISRTLGEWFGTQLREGGLYEGVDVIVPIPLHRRRLLKRGYNQSEYIAQGIARTLGKPLCCGNVVRSGYNRSQTRTRDHNDRWENVEGIFSVRRPEALAERHILLVDDVLTTGATLISCGETILRNVPGSRISIATLAVSAYELFGKHSGGL